MWSQRTEVIFWTSIYVTPTVTLATSEIPTFLRSPRGLFNCLTAFLVSSSAAALSCTGLKCHACFEFNTAKRSFTHVCLIALFSVLVFVFLESDDRSCRRLRHCSLVNSSTLDKIEALQTMKCCTAKRCYAVVNFSFVMFWARLLPMNTFFCAE